MDEVTQAAIQKIERKRFALALEQQQLRMKHEDIELERMRLAQDVQFLEAGMDCPVGRALNKSKSTA